jgi:hypothetical protein
MRLLPLLALLLAACPPTEAEQPEPVIPDLSGSYTLVFAQANTECLPPDYTFADVFGFLDDVADGTPVSSATFVQDGTALAITLHSSECTLEGGVGEAGSFDVAGPCDDAQMNRRVLMQGDASRSGLTGWRIDASAVFEVDRDDGEGGGPDGVVDCEVTQVDVNGSGAPSD